MRSKPSDFGFGFMLAWLWILFMNGPLLYHVCIRWHVSPERAFLLFLAVHTFSFFVIGELLRGVLSGSLYQRLVIWCTVGVSSCTAMLAFGRISSESSSFIFITLCAILGILAAFLMIAWGNRFCGLLPPSMGISYAGAVVLGTLIFFIANWLMPPLKVLLVSLLPVLSVMCLLETFGPHRESIVSTDINPRFRLPNRLVLIIILFNFVGGFMYKVVFLWENTGSQLYWATNVIYAMMAAIVGFVISRDKSFQIGNLYRFATPLLGIGFMLVPLIKVVPGITPFLLIQSGFALFDMYTWMTFAQLGKQHNNPIRAYGLGLFNTTGAILAGDLVFACMGPFLPQSISKIELIPVAAAVILFAATLLLKEDVTVPELCSTGSIVPSERSGEHALQSIDGSVDPTITGCGVSEHSAIRVSKEHEAPLDGDSSFSSNNDCEAEFALSLGLTRRETQVLLLILNGRNNPYIRECLNISNNTLKTHLRNIYQKAQVHDRQQLVTLYEDFWIQ